MNAAFRAEAARQRHVDRFERKLLGKRFFGQRFAPRIESGLNLGLGTIDLLTARTALLRRKLAELLHEHRDAAGLADVARFGVFESGGLLRFSEVLLRGLDQFGKFLHVESLFAVLVERRHK